MREEADPFLGLGALGFGPAAKFRAAIRPLEQPRGAKAGDEEKMTRFVQAIDACFHSASISAQGVGQRRGEAAANANDLADLRNLQEFVPPPP